MQKQLFRESATIKRAKWIKSINNDLPWTEFDKKLQSEVLRHFRNAMDWEIHKLE